MNDPAAPPKKKKKNTALWVGLVILILGGGGCGLCCVSGVGLSWFGLGELEKDLGGQLENNPTLVQHIGVVDSFDYDIMGSGEYSAWSTTVYKVHGSRGSGKVVLQSHTSDDWQYEEIDWAVLFVAGGPRVDLLGYPPADLPSPGSSY
jgi:hypothetical protein